MANMSILANEKEDLISTQKFQHALYMHKLFFWGMFS